MIPKLNQTVYFEAHNTICSGEICSIEPNFQTANVWADDVSYSRKYSDIYETEAEMKNAIMSRKQSYKAGIKDTFDLIQCICDNASVIAGNKSNYALILAIQEQSEEFTGKRVSL